MSTYPLKLGMLMASCLIGLVLGFSRAAFSEDSDAHSVDESPSYSTSNTTSNSKSARSRPPEPLGVLWQAHWSAGVLIPRGQRNAVEVSFGPRLCDYMQSQHVCGVQYFSIETDTRHSHVSAGIGYFGQGHGIPGGIFYDWGLISDGERRLSRRRTLTISTPPVFFPVFFRWTERGGKRDDFSFGFTIKYVNMRGLF